MDSDDIKKIIKKYNEIKKRNGDLVKQYGGIFGDYQLENGIVFDNHNNEKLVSELVRVKKINREMLNIINNEEIMIGGTDDNRTTYDIIKSEYDISLGRRIANALKVYDTRNNTLIIDDILLTIPGYNGIISENYDIIAKFNAIEFIEKKTKKKYTMNIAPIIDYEITISNNSITLRNIILNEIKKSNKTYSGNIINDYEIVNNNNLIVLKDKINNKIKYTIDAKKIIIDMLDLNKYITKQINDRSKFNIDIEDNALVFTEKSTNIPTHINFKSLVINKINLKQLILEKIKTVKPSYNGNIISDYNIDFDKHNIILENKTNKQKIYIGIFDLLVQSDLNSLMFINNGIKYNDKNDIYHMELSIHNCDMIIKNKQLPFNTFYIDSILPIYYDSIFKNDNILNDYTYYNRYSDKNKYYLSSGYQHKLWEKCVETYNTTNDKWVCKDSWDEYIIFDRLQKVTTVLNKYIDRSTLDKVQNINFIYDRSILEKFRDFKFIDDIIKNMRRENVNISLNKFNMNTIIDKIIRNSGGKGNIKNTIIKLSDILLYVQTTDQIILNYLMYIIVTKIINHYFGPSKEPKSVFVCAYICTGIANRFPIFIDYVIRKIYDMCQFCIPMNPPNIELQELSKKKIAI